MQRNANQLPESNLHDCMKVCNRDLELGSSTTCLTAQIDKEIKKKEKASTQRRSLPLIEYRELLPQFIIDFFKHNLCFVELFLRLSKLKYELKIQPSKLTTNIWIERNTPMLPLLLWFHLFSWQPEVLPSGVGLNHSQQAFGRALLLFPSTYKKSQHESLAEEKCTYLLDKKN